MNGLVLVEISNRTQLFSFILEITMAVLLLLVLSVITLIGYLILRVNNHWAKRNVEYMKPKLIGGFGFDLFTKNVNFLIRDDYDSISGPFGGFYMLFRPMWLIKDPELIKSVLIKDFDHFVNRGLYVNEKRDPLTGNLLMLQGERWRFMRNKLTPTFTSGKLKSIFPLVTCIGDRLKTKIDSILDQNVEVRDLMACFTTDVIASVIFGIETDCINNPGDEFRVIGDRAMHPDAWGFLREVMAMTLPSIVDMFKIKVSDQQVVRFMRNITIQVLNLRENEKIVRQDFMQLMVQLRNGGKITDDDQWSTSIVDESCKQLTIDEIMAQVFIFFAGGFETSSTTIAFTLFHLANNTNIQNRLQHEIDETLTKYNGTLTYEAIHEMKYLGQVIDETLRLYPPVPVLFREATKDYKIPTTNVIIKKGEPVVISVHGIQTDSEHYDDPWLYDPDRFSSESRATRNPYTYLPFGDGPRNCIGMRMALLQMKIGLSLLLAKYDVDLGTGQSSTLEFHAMRVGFDVKGGLNLKFRNRK